MARIRTIKPEFFRHEGLQDLEVANPGKHCMLVFAGLWAIADREGRFEWRPRRIKLDVLPFLEFDMESTLSILEGEGLIERYEHAGEMFGAVVSWERHQIVGRDEPPSEIPAPSGEKTPYFRPLNQTQRLKVYERDKWTCAYCARDMRNDRRAACLDHVVPYSSGGTNREQNLVTSCKRCNSLKSNKTPHEAGLAWPAGLGEYLDKESNEVRQWGVNTPLTGGSANPDKEREREGERERGREEEGNGVRGTTSPLSADADPLRCPTEELLALYHETMPSNPRCKVLNPARRASMRARWLEAARLDCQPFGYSTREEGLKAWRLFFEVCNESPFLTGRAKPMPGKPPFLADVDFLFSPGGFAKCIENKYHREAA